MRVACRDTPDTNEARGLKKRQSSVDVPVRADAGILINFRQVRIIFLQRFGYLLAFRCFPRLENS
jgi:hypothetical protein